MSATRETEIRKVASFLFGEGGLIPPRAAFFPFNRRMRGN
jgi:hypothetical protein